MTTSLFLDSFTGAAGLLAAHAPEVGAWSSTDPNARINSARLQGDGTLALNAQDGWTDFYQVPVPNAGVMVALELDFGTIVAVPNGQWSLDLYDAAHRLFIEMWDENGVMGSRITVYQINADQSQTQLYQGGIGGIVRGQSNTLRVEVIAGGFRFLMNGGNANEQNLGITFSQTTNIRFFYDEYTTPKVPSYSFSRLQIFGSTPPAAFWTDFEGTTELVSAQTLTKNISATYTPSTAGDSGTPATPGTPAYTTYENVQVCSFVVDGGQYEWLTPDGGGDPQYVLVPTSGTTATGSYQCRMVKKPVYHPAVPPSPGTPAIAPTVESTMLDLALGWNAGARSLGLIFGSGLAQFTLGSAVGVAAGFNSANLGAGYGEIQHGFLLASGLVRIIERGAAVFTAGTYAVGDVFEVRRDGSQVSYWQNNALVYTSSSPSTGTVFLDASMYAGGDVIQNAALGVLSRSRLTLPHLAVSAGTGTQPAAAAIVLPALSVSSSWAQGASLVLPALRMNGGFGVHGSAAIVLPALTLQADGGYTMAPYALATVSLPRFSLVANMLTGQIANAALQLPALNARGSDRIYGDARLTLPALHVFADGREGPLQASVFQMARAGASITAQAALSVVMNSAGQIAAVMAYSVVIPATMDDGAHAEDALAAQAVLQAAMQDGATVRVTGAGEDPRTTDWEVWSLDWATGDSTAYEGFEFNSFAKIGSSYFGAKRDGVYLLDGDSDAGEPIRASIHFGAHDFGSSVHKRVPNVYAGVSASGQLLLRVSVDGGSDYLYAARRVDAARKMTRFDLGRGLRGTYYTFELFNEEGADFDLDSIEFLPVALTRRI